MCWLLNFFLAFCIFFFDQSAALAGHCCSPRSGASSHTSSIKSHQNRLRSSTLSSSSSSIWHHTKFNKMYFWFIFIAFFCVYWLISSGSRQGRQEFKSNYANRCGENDNNNKNREINWPLIENHKNEHVQRRQKKFRRLIWAEHFMVYVSNDLSGDEINEIERIKQDKKKSFFFAPLSVERSKHLCHCFEHRTRTLRNNIATTDQPTTIHPSKNVNTEL